MYVSSLIFALMETVLQSFDEQSCKATTQPRPWLPRLFPGELFAFY